MERYNKDITQEEDQINIKSDSPHNSNRNKSRTSRREKRAPVTRSEGFMWSLV
jgi:hypothetical protein